MNRARGPGYPRSPCQDRETDPTPRRPDRAAPRVAAEIEDERLHPLLEQGVDRLADVPGRALANWAERDVPDAVVEHHRDPWIDRADVNIRPSEFVRDRLVDAGAPDLELRICSRRSPQRFHRRV